MPIRGGCVPGKRITKEKHTKTPGAETKVHYLDENAIRLATCWFLKELINDSFSSLRQAVNPKSHGGKGQSDRDRLESVKDFMRERHPQGVRIFEVAG